MAVVTQYFSYETSSWVEGQGADKQYDMLVLLPDGHNPAVAYPWALLCHGAGNNARDFDESDPTGDYPAYTVANAFLTAGYVVVAPYQTGAYVWGNDAALAGIENCHAKAVADYNLAEKAIIGGNSMGGMAGLLTLKNNPTWFKGGAFLYPSSNLDASHTPDAGNADYNAVINTAYSCNDATYEAATVGHHPEDYESNYAALNIPFRIWHGDSDTVINPNQSSTFKTDVEAIGPSTVIVTSVVGGTHGDSDVADQYAADLPTFLAQFPTKGVPPHPFLWLRR